MADFFDSIPTITVILLALGVVGVMVYERTRLRQEKQQDNSSWNFTKIQIYRVWKSNWNSKTGYSKNTWREKLSNNRTNWFW